MYDTPAFVFTVTVYTSDPGVPDDAFDAAADQLRRDLEYAVTRLPVTFRATVEES